MKRLGATSAVAARSAITAGLLALLLCGLCQPAAAQVQTQILDLNSEALDAYQNLDLDTASAKLQEALSLAEQNGYSGPEVAQTLINLGVVFVAGYGDPQQGLDAFISALCMQPDIQLDPLLSTPDVQQVFLQAQSEAQAGACGGAPAPTPQPQPPPQPYMPGPQPGPTRAALDNECPPGMKCDTGWGGDSEPEDPGEFARFFVNLQFTTGFAWVTSGMEADSAPPISPEPLPGTADPRPGTSDELFMYGSEVIDFNPDGMIDNQDVERYRMSLVNMGLDPIMAGDVNGNGMLDIGDLPARTTRVFVTDSAWVPDADSFDDASQITPVSPKCEADGVRTGPTDLVDDETGELFQQAEPSSYCARVEAPGFVFNPALRINLGYWLTDSFALSLPIRLQFSAGEGSLSNLLLGLRGELLLNSDATKTATGFPISLFFGATYGQIQAKPPPKFADRPAPYVVSGPVGAHVGVNVRFRVHRHFGFIISPEADLMFPDVLFNGDLAFGVEGAL